MTQQQYPGGWGQQPGGPADYAASQGAQQQQQQQPFPQGGPPGYGAPPPPARGPGFMDALKAPQGAHKVLWLGAVLMIFSFAVKQVFVDLSVSSVSGLIEVERLRAKQRAEISEIDVALDPVDAEIDELAAQAPEPPKVAEQAAEPPAADVAAYETKKKDFDEKMGKLKVKREALDKELEPKRKKVAQEYRPKLVEAERSVTKSGASAIARAQLTLCLKLAVDLFKLLGSALVVLSALRISVDPDQSGGAKAYAAVLGGIAFLAMAVGGLYSALFG